MSGTKVSIDQMAAALKKQTELYAELVYSDLEEAVDTTAKECVADIKEAARGYGWKDYPDTWASKVTGKGSMKYERTVNAMKNGGYRLSHLLENGHATKNGSRTKKYPHIAPAEEAAKERFMELLTNAVGGH